MNFLVIGTNFISDLFAEALAVLRERGAETKIGAVLSRRRETGRAFIERNSLDPATHVATNLSSAYRLFEAGAFDAAYVASPNVCHAEQSTFFLDRGVPVLCEKPAATSVAELERVFAASARSGAVFMEAMRTVHEPIMTRFSDSLSLISPIRSARLEFSQYSSRYDRFLAGEKVNTFDPAMGNSALADLGVYTIAAAQTIFGEPTSIAGASAARLENGFEASGAAIFEYPGFVCTLSWSKVCRQSAPSAILGERGAITIDRLSEPREVRMIRDGKDESMYSINAKDNNMIYEIAEFITAEDEPSIARKYAADSMARALLVDCVKSLAAR